VKGPLHVLLCVADHFEPFHKTVGSDGVARGGASPAEARHAVKQWAKDYRESVRGLRDSDDRSPVHTFFYPQEEYDFGCLDLLAGLTAEGLAEVEVHLHHRNDTAAGLRKKLVSFRDTLRKDHGLLGEWREVGSQRSEVGGQPSTISHQPFSLPAYGFVHGNWALCNSRPDGDWCGVNEELGVLAQTGCYADFTFPSAPSPTQPRTVNAIYRAHDRPGKPRSHDRGFPLSTSSTVNHQPSTVLIQGPLALNWHRRKWGLLPRLESADLSAANPPSLARADLWLRQHIHVRGRPDWIFIKLSTHGAVPANAGTLLGPAMRALHQYLRSDRRCRLHYVSAREMYNIARAAEDGRTGNPASCRDYQVTPPPCVQHK